MYIIGAFAVKNTAGSLLDKVERGEEFVILRRGKPVAPLVRGGLINDKYTAVITLCWAGIAMINLWDRGSNK